MIELGQSVSENRIFTEQDVLQFAKISGDENPIHLNEEFAKSSPFGQRIVHGILVASVFSKLCATDLPGPGSVYLGQTLKFLKPVFIGDKLRFTITVIHVRTDKPIITLRTQCWNNRGDLVIEGEAVVKATTA